MTKEEFVQKYCTENHTIWTTHEDSEYYRIKSILNFLGVNIFYKDNCPYIMYFTPNINKEKKYEYFEHYDFLTDWATVPEYKYEYSEFIIPRILYENGIRDEVLRIENMIRHTDIFDYFYNLRTTSEYSLYWTSKSKDIIVILRNCGEYYVRMK